MIVRELTEGAFAPFGEVLTVPSETGRFAADAALQSRRPAARTSLSFIQREPVAPPLLVRQMERHVFSSQSFIPLTPSRFLVLVAPHAVGGGPDMAAAAAFLATPGQGVTYGADTWHHPLAVLDAPARFAILMWLDGSADDEEFVDVAPFTLTF